MFKNDLYLEIQPGGFKDQIDYNDFLVQLAKDFQIEMVATNDIHYLCKEDYATHNWHVRDCRKYDDIKGLSEEYEDFSVNMDNLEDDNMDNPIDKKKLI